MKKIFLSLCLTILSQFAFSQTYFVMKVMGNIKVSETGKALKTGDKIDAKTALIFGSPTAKAMVASPKTGRLLLQATKVKPVANGELMAFVNDVLLPSKSNKRLSTRGNKTEKAVLNVKDFFGDGNYLIIGDDFTVTLDAAKYPLSKTKIFVFTYEAAGETIKKKVKAEGQNIILKSSLFRKKERTFAVENITNPALYYFDREIKSNAKVAEFTPIFTDEAALTEELKNAVNYFRNEERVPAEKMEEKLYNYILDAYGKINDAVFAKWAKENGLL